MPLTFGQTEKLRKAEVMLKEFDMETNYKFGFSTFSKSFLAYRANRNYREVFSKMVKNNQG